MNVCKHNIWTKTPSKLLTHQIEWRTKEKGANAPEQEEYGGRVGWGVNNSDRACDVLECLQARYLDKSTISKMVSITQPLNRMKHKRKGSERTWTRRIWEWSIINGHKCVRVQSHMRENAEKTSLQALTLFNYLDSGQGLGSLDCCGWRGQNSWPYCCRLRHWCCVVGGRNPVIGSHMSVCVHSAVSDIIYPLLMVGRLMVVTNKPTCWVQYVRMCLQMLVLLQCIQISVFCPEWVHTRAGADRLDNASAVPIFIWRESGRNPTGTHK